MKDLRLPEEERGVLRWGGLAGIAGGVVFVGAIVVSVLLVGADPTDLEGWVTRFPDIQAARTAENGLYLLALVLWIVHFLALYRALRRTSLAPALFGGALGVLGATVLAAGALPHVATLPLSELYQAPGATPEAQATLALLWQATWGVYDAFVIAGLVLLPLGVTALGAAMLGAPGFGRGFGAVSLVLGGAGIVAAVVVLIDPASIFALVGMLGLIVFHAVLGWRLTRLASGPREAFGRGVRARQP